MVNMKELRKAIKGLYTDTNIYVKIDNAVYSIKEIHRSIGGDSMTLIADIDKKYS